MGKLIQFPKPAPKVATGEYFVRIGKSTVKLTIDVSARRLTQYEKLASPEAPAGVPEGGE